MLLSILQVPYKMKYRWGVNFGNFIQKSPIFNPPIAIIMYMCYILLNSSILISSKCFSMHFAKQYSHQYFILYGTLKWYAILATKLTNLPYLAVCSIRVVEYHILLVIAAPQIVTVSSSRLKTINLCFKRNFDIKVTSLHLFVPEIYSSHGY